MSEQFQENLKAAEGFLKRYKARTLPHFINGQEYIGDPQRVFENVTPVDNTSLGMVAMGSVADVDRACQAAWAAFPAWRDLPGKERKKILNRFADLIEARAEEIALVESMDTGQAIRFMSKAAIRGAENFRYFADKAPEARDGQSLMAQEHMNYTVREPIGPVGVITPWNTPFMLSTWKIAPALAAGCTIVHKPAEWTPLTAMLLAEIAQEAGIPAGVWNVVHGFGEEAGKALTEHEHIKAVAFVGESMTGSLIQAQGAPTLKRVHFELGGKNPVVVFDDADFDRAVDAVVCMIYSLNGERCTSSSRLLVQNSIYDKFVDAVAERVRKIKVGHPLDPDTEVGPLVHRKHQDKVLSYMGLAREAGAVIAVGGERASDTGCYVQPTLFTRANNGMRIAQEEIFGPVLTAIPFEDEADALKIANDVQYGLAAYLWTGNVGRAHRFAQAVEAGMVWVNSENNRNLPSPFGGTKMSGVGRDGGDYSFEFYMETKNICISLGEHRIPRLGV